MKMYKYKRIRTNRCKDIQLRTNMHKSLQVCTEKCKYMQMRTTAYKYVQMRTHAYTYVQAKQTTCFQIRIDTYKHIQMRMDAYKYVQILTNAYKYVRSAYECVQAETGGHKARQHRNNGCDNENQKQSEHRQCELWRSTMQNRTKADTDNERIEMGACCLGCK